MSVYEGDAFKCKRTSLIEFVLFLNFEKRESSKYILGKDSHGKHVGVKGQ